MLYKMDAVVKATPVKKLPTTSTETELALADRIAPAKPTRLGRMAMYFRLVASERRPTIGAKALWTRSGPYNASIYSYGQLMCMNC